MSVDAEGLQRFEVGSLPTNCYVLDDRFVVDPGGMSSDLENYLESVDELEAILLTHTHWDHIAGIEAVRDRFPDCRILCHSKEFGMLEDPEKNFSSMMGSGVSYEADAELESCALRVQGDALTVLHTPGHSPGGVSLHWAEQDVLLSGDALFQQGVGRTDLPGSDRSTLRDSLKNILMELPDETRVYPGHGPSTTIGQERKTNPFL
jgi:hydroxyacylglutathione hydrolase